MNQSQRDEINAWISESEMKDPTVSELYTMLKTDFISLINM